MISLPTNIGIEDDLLVLLAIVTRSYRVGRPRSTAGGGFLLGRWVRKGLRSWRVLAQPRQVIDGAVRVVGPEQIVIDHLGVMLDHIQARMTEQGLQVQDVHPAAQRENDECSAQGMRRNVDTGPFPKAAEDQQNSSARQAHAITREK